MIRDMAAALSLKTSAQAASAVVLPTELPVERLAEVFHIGTMRAADKSDFSYEGSGFSISLDPDAWEAIARLGGLPWWKLSKADGRFLMAHDLTEGRREQISAWGIAEGYAVEITCYEVSRVDDELGGEVTSIYEDIAEAEWEAEECEAELTEGRTLKATEKLRQAISVQTDLNCFDHLLGIYAEQMTDVDGIWWADEYGHLSAPRGVIFRDRLHTWTAVRCCQDDLFIDS